jgi:hypothetical protein
MKKSILSALTAALLFTASTVVAQVSFGPKAALNVASIHDKSKDASYTAQSYDSKIGFQVGGMLNAQLSDYFTIRPELTLNSVGAKRSSGGTDFTYMSNYLYLPVNFVGQYPVSDNFKLQAFVGPYAALGLGGRIKYENAVVSGSQKINMGKDLGNTAAIYQNPLDFGLNFGAGFQASSFVFSASYAMGMSNLQPHYSNSIAEDNRGKYSKTTNRNISFGIAYLFGGK